MNKAWIIVTERLPLLVFLGMYAFSCYLGVLFLLVSRDFWAWTNFFSGPRMPALDSKQVWILLALLNGGPILLWAGYESATKLCRKFFRPERLDFMSHDLSSGYMDIVLFSLSVAATLFSLLRAGAFSNLGAWTNYNAYIQARWALFSRLRFFEYVNLYTWLPLSSALLLLCRRQRRWLFIPVLGTLALLQLSLFLKKSLLTSIILIGCAAWAYWYGGKSPRKEARVRSWLLGVTALCLVLYSVHAALSMRLVLSSKPKVVQSKPEVKVGTLEKPAIVKFNSNTVPTVSGRSVISYAFFAPLTRTSVPTIAYPALFPSRIPYYRLDLGLDLLGFGRMPDDNLTVCDYLWPGQKGSVAAPFHFVLYSQGGILVGLLGAFVLGGFLALCWYPVSSCTKKVSVSGSLFAGVVLTYAWLISIDSLRNNTLESYGMVWAIVFIAFLYWWDRKSRAGRQLPGPRSEAGLERTQAP